MAMLEKRADKNASASVARVWLCVSFSRSATWRLLLSPRSSAFLRLVATTAVLIAASKGRSTKRKGRSRKGRGERTERARPELPGQARGRPLIDGRMDGCRWMDPCRLLLVCHCLVLSLLASASSVLVLLSATPFPLQFTRAEKSGQWLRVESSRVSRSEIVADSR